MAELTAKQQAYVAACQACEERQAKALNPANVRIGEHASQDVALITCTSDMHGVFPFCERWIRAQTYTGRIQWIVIDDGKSPQVCTMGQQHVRRERQPTDPQHTLPQNLLAALPHIEAEKILFIEPDDYYGPRFVEHYVRLLDAHEAVGETRCRYYHLPLRRYARQSNTRHASLSQTGIRRGVLPLLKRATLAMPNCPAIDVRLWRQLRRSARKCKLFADRRDDLCLHVSLKGITLGDDHPCRAHHRNNPRYARRADPDGSVLNRWIGDDEIAATYAAMWPTPLN